MTTRGSFDLVLKGRKMGKKKATPKKSASKPPAKKPSDPHMHAPVRGGTRKVYV